MCMIEVDDIKPFLNKEVTIKCTDLFDENNVWFYYGKILRITDKQVKIEFLKKPGFTFIPINRILSVEGRNRQRWSY